MVCEFVGSIGSTGEKDHLFTTDDPTMVKELGLSAFTLEDLFNALETRIPLWQLPFAPNINTAIQTILKPTGTLFGASNPGTCTRPGVPGSLDLTGWETAWCGAADPASVCGSAEEYCEYLTLTPTGSNGVYTPPTGSSSAIPGALSFEEFVVAEGEYKWRYIGMGGIAENYSNPTGGPNEASTYAGLWRFNEVRQIILLNKTLWGESFAAENWDLPYTEIYAKALIDAIQASPDGCLTFKSQFRYNFSVNGEAQCEKEITPTFRLYLYDRHYEKPGERMLASDGPMRIVTKTKSASGQPHGAQQPNAGVGELPKLTGGHADDTGGELDMHFEPNTGKYESGTTNILARLLTNLDAVTVNPIDPATIDDADMKSFTDPKSPTFLGPWAGGWALPLTVHKGNPHLFVPTFIDKDCAPEGKGGTCTYADGTIADVSDWRLLHCTPGGDPCTSEEEYCMYVTTNASTGDKGTYTPATNNEKYKIKVINRTARSFAAGDLVMCFRIHGLWYVMGFNDEATEGPGQKVFKMGKWSFMNVIAERRSFFRDDRYFKTFTVPTDPPPIPPPDISAPTNPVSYESYFRENWFYEMAYTPAITPVGDAPFSANDTLNDSSVNDYEKIGKKNLTWGQNVDQLAAITARNFSSCLGGYYQQSSFDMLHKTLGGVNTEGNMIARTHLFLSPDGTESQEGVQKRSFIPFWGATFPDGYHPDKIKYLRSSTHNMARYGNSEDLIGEDLPHIGSWIGPAVDGPPVAGIFSPDHNKNTAGDGFVTQGLWTASQDQNGLQVPADVALLASPSGENGYGMEAFYDFNNNCSFIGGTTAGAGSTPSFPYKTMNYMLPDVNGYPSRFNWLVIDDESDPDNSGTLPSLYDFKPIKPNIVEFKPLWADYLGSLDISNSNDPDISIYEEDEQYYKHSRKNLIGYYPLVGPPAAIVSASFLNRIIASAGTNIVQTENGFGFTVPPWNGVPYGRMVGGSTIPHIRFASNQDSGNIVGLTLAKAKIQVKAAALNFLTNQRFGLQNVVRASHGGGVDSHVFGGGIIMNATGPGATNNRSAQWGRNPDTPWQNGAFGTTALHVRMCDQWPDAQTLLDPRYFAVMHFNPAGGVYQNGTSLDVESIPPEPGVWSRTETINEDLGTLTEEKANHGWTQGYGIPAYQHKVDISYTTVDLRVPTTIENDGLTQVIMDAVQITNAELSSGDISINGDELAGPGRTLLDPSQWNINPVRRGQLLPFTYPHRVIGLKFKNGHIGSDDFLVPPFPTNSSGGTAVDKLGTGFAKEDLITATGGDGSVEIVVMDVDGDGRITDWRVTKDDLENHNIGEGYLPREFPTSFGITNGGHEGSVKLVTKTGSGTGLDYTDEFGKTLIREGLVYDRWKIDEGPTKYGIDQISPRSNPPTGYGSEGGRVVGQKSHSIQLDPEHDGAYDLFFLFHADVQHYLAEDITFSNNAAQFCNMEITASN